MYYIYIYEYTCLCECESKCEKKFVSKKEKNVNNVSTSAATPVVSPAFLSVWN